ncbi:MAG: hypothetical protein N2258_04740 [Brevinematales bacterium]|nr:hypothetical protein [Brevinematales bacterium]
MEDFIGHRKLINFIDKIIDKNISGRVLLIDGQRGVGKFTLSLKIAEKILGRNPFLSNNFLFYRNDDFLLKTRFYLKYIKENGKEFKKVKNYFFYLFSRALLGIKYGEISNFKVNGFEEKVKIDVTQFLYDVTNKLINEYEIDFISYEEILLRISEEISKKKVIPINFVREWKEFDNIKSTDGKKVILVGDFEEATIEAQNSALKILEEPSFDTLVILTSSNLKGIFPTIISRCLVLRAGNLNAKEINEIFKISIEHNNTNTIDFMKDYLFDYRALLKERVLYFFQNVAPFIQKNGSLVFEFSEKLSKDGREFVISFLEEIIIFLRELHIFRQFYLRNSKVGVKYEELINNLYSKTYVSEIHSIGVEIISLIQKLKNNENFSINFVLTDIFIRISRWYQKALARKKFL